MSCTVKRENGRVKKVVLPDGVTESKTYTDILNNIKNISPADNQLMIEEIRWLEGTHIKNVTDPREIALGLYMLTYTNGFKDWHGANGVKNELGEAKVIPFKNAFVYSRDKNPDIGDVRPFIQPTKKTSKLKSANYIKTTKTAATIKSVQTTLNILKDRLRSFYDGLEKTKLDKTLGYQERLIRIQEYTNKITKTQANIKDVEDRNTVDVVFGQAFDDLEFVASVVKDPVKKLNEVRIAKTAADSWLSIIDILGIKSIDDIADSKQKQQAEQIIKDAYYLKGKIFEISKQMVAQKLMSDQKTATEKDVEVFRDTNIIVRNTLDLSRTGIPLVSYLAKKITRLNLRINKEHNDNHSMIDNMYDRIKNHPLFKKMGYSLFTVTHKDKSGKEVMGMRSRYSQKYYDTTRKRFDTFHVDLEKAKLDEDKPAIEKIYLELNEWLKTNKNIYNWNVFIEEDPLAHTKLKYSDADREAVLDQMKSDGFTPEEINDFIKTQIKQYDRYKEELKKYESLLEIEITNGADTEGLSPDDFMNQKIKKFKELNDPVTYIKQILDPKTKIVTARKGYQFTLMVPKKIVNGKNSEYYDDEFQKIAEDKDLYDFYIFSRNFIDEQLSYLPEHKVWGLQSNFLPVIAMELATDYGAMSANGMLNGIGDWFMKALTSVSHNDKQDKNPITGLPINTFNAKFIDSNDVSIENRSNDFQVMMKMFADMASVYKHKLQVQDEIETVNDIIQSADKKLIEGKMGELEVIEKAPENIKAMVDSTIERSFYGKAPEKEGVIKKRKFYNIGELLSGGLYKSKKYKIAKEIQEKIKRIDDKIDKGGLTEKQIENLTEDRKDLVNRYEGMGGREFAMSQLSDALVSFSRHKGIAFNPLSAFRNLAVGGINNIVHAVGGEDFNVTELKKATGIIKSSAAKYLTWGTAKSKTAEKILRVMLDTGTIEGSDNEFKNGKIKSTSTLAQIKKVIPSPFGLMKSTDYIFKAQTTVSLMLSMKVKTDKGEFSLFEVLDENRNFNEDKFGKWLDAENGNFNFDEFYENFLAKNSQIAKKLHGFSGSTLSLAGKDHAVMRMIFLFRTWLPETFAARFEGKKMDEELGREVEGYYRTFFKDIVSGSIPKMIKAVFSASSKGEMDPLERANLRKMFAEISAVLAITSIYLIVKGVGSGDDDKNKARRLLLNQITALRRDLTYYSDLSSAGQLLNNLFPVIGTFKDAGEAVNAVFNYSVGTEDTNGDVLYDGERTMLKITKALPYLNNINRMKYQMEKVL